MATEHPPTSYEAHQSKRQEDAEDLELGGTPFSPRQVDEDLEYGGTPFDKRQVDEDLEYGGTPFDKRQDEEGLESASPFDDITSRSA